MHYRWIGGGADLIGTDYDHAKLVLGSKMLIKEYLVLKVDDEYIPMDDEHVRYYSVVKKKGLSSLAGSTASVIFGPAVHTIAVIASGGRSRKKTLFIKLKNDKRVLVRLYDGYFHLMKSKNKRPMENIDSNDIRWIQGFSDRGLF